MTIEQTCEERESLMIDQLIGLAETQRRIYEVLHPNEKLEEIYKLHQKELELLIKYQKEIL